MSRTTATSPSQTFALTAPQREIWFDQLLHPHVPLYNIGGYFDIHRGVEHALFTRAVQRLVAGHDALRTVLSAVDGSELPAQRHAPELFFELPLVDFSAQPHPDDDAAAWMQERFTAPFTLHGAPLFRFALLKFSDQRYRFFFVYHHLITDGWGISLLNKRLGKIYAALLDDAEPEPAWNFPAYQAFIGSDQAYAGSPRFTDDLDYWKAKYASLPEPLWRKKAPRGGERQALSQRQVLWLQRPFYNRVIEYARAADATPFNVMLCALYVYFTRTARRDELAVGLPILNRGGAAFKETVGLFINMIPARFSFGTNLSFRELLLAVGRALKSDYRHQKLPIGELYRALDFHKSGQRNLIDLQFNYAKHDHDTETGIFQGKTVALTNDAKQSPLIISVWEFHDDEDVQMDFVFNLAYLDGGEVERITAGFLRILEHVLDHGDCPVGDIPLLSEADQYQLAAWNPPAQVSYPAATLVELFEAQAAQTPAHTAVVYERQSLTYAELNARANQIAHGLIRLGVGPETLVGICVERSLHMVVGLLAILKAGGAYVPLDPDYPAERLAFMLEDSAVPVLLTQRHLLATLPAHTAATLCLDQGEAGISELPAYNPGVNISPEHLAYVIYTSGSTGKPKGCLVTHGNVTRLFDVSQPLYRFDATDVWTLFHSYAFDFSVWEIWGALLYGGKLVVVPYLTSRDPALFYELLLTQRVTVLNQTPSAFRQLIAVDDQPQALALRHVIFGGEALDFAALQPWFARHGASRPRLVNMYGITETTVHVTYGPLTGAQTESGAIGRPLSDLQVWILDAHLQPLPVGTAGEMFVGGAGVSRGYLNRPELTADRFVTAQLLGREVRLYKTGDLARQLPDGGLEYLGRIDQQVKIRGFRIELGEIENRLTQHPAVHEAVVMPHGEGDNTRLVAYFTLYDTLDDAAHALRAWLATRLPDYMLPSHFMALNQLPLTANGKIDRKALPVPNAVAASGFLAPETPAQQLVADIWQRVLGVERVGQHDDFFAIGGNSLNGIRFINELNATTGEIFHIYDLFAAPELARFVDGMRAHYPQLMARLEGETAAGGTPARRHEKVAAADMAQLRQLLPRPQFQARKSAQKNPPAVFILAPPRSGTTLLRVMLGGHPGLFAPPELELLGFDTLQERSRRCAAKDSFWLQGSVRALMELNGCDADAAWQQMAAYENQGLDVAGFYRVLQEAAPGRLLVDKTPFYSVDLDILRNAEEIFEGALYIHLQRHPLGMIRSFEKARMERIISGHPYAAPLAALGLEEKGGSSTRLGEMLWQQCNANILEFLADIPEQRRHTVKFEELTSRPQQVSQALCEFLGLAADEALLRPYEDKKGRMTDGVHADGHMLGDIKFHTHDKIDAQVADGWRQAYKEDFLGEATWALAQRLGYPRELQGAQGAHIAPLAAGEAAPLSYAQQRLWFLAQLEGRSATYNVPMALRLRGALDVAALRTAFTQLLQRHEGLRASFPAVNGEPTVRTAAPWDALTLVEPPAPNATAQQAWFQDWLHEQVHRPFDLERGPLLRLHLVRLDAREHVLLLNMHHIVSDGWSLGVLVREWSALYAAALEGRDAALPAPSIQYADYAAWQKRWLAQGALAPQLAYWQAQLAGAPALLELPTDFPRPAVMRHVGRHFKTHLPAALADALRALGRQEGATLFMTLLAAFKVLLYRHSRQADLAVGTPIANRHQHQTEQVAGFFVNSLVLRSRLDGQADFLTLLRQVRDTALQAYAHQDVPFELLVEKLNPARSMSHSPLFQVMFMLQSMEQPGFAGLDMELLEPDYRVAKFDLTLTAAERDGALTCTWEYDSELFREETIAALAAHFEVLLQGIAAHPRQAVDRLPLLTARDIARLEAPAAVETPAAVATVVATFEAQATQHPERVAVVFEGQSLTYGELNRRANQLAHALMARGVGADTLVGLCVERSLDMLTGLLGILKAGGAYVPLDPDQPRERLNFILADAAPPVLLTQTHLRERLPQVAGMATLALDGDWDAIARLPDANPPLRASAEHLAYVIYTSGSTGQPKGCLVTHGNVNRLFTATDPWYGFNQQDVWTLFHSYAFDFSVWEIWGALLYGGKLVVVPYLTSRDPQAFYQLLLDEGVTVLNQTPSAFRQLMAVDTQPDQLALRHVIFGGEALDAGILKPWYEKHGPAQPRLVNMYGITETTVHVTYAPLGVENPLAGDIGIPIPDLQVWILDAAHEPLPDGVPGEMYVGGAGVARGYLNRPALTAERFIEIELLGRRRRLYKTGDLARRLADGSLEYLGRCDNQVKLRGFRIELGEIEAVLNQHPAVREAVVLLDETQGHARLLAHVVADAQASVPALADALKTWLKTRLPDYMVPAGFNVLDVLPLTGNGKIDRRALAALDIQPARQGIHEPPRNDGETRMVELWAQVLRLPPAQIGVHDNFFHLGGHSLMATQLISRIRTAFEAELPLRHLFEMPTVAELCQWLAATQPAAADAMEMEEGEF